jgi:hypothetical protein
MLCPANLLVKQAALDSFRISDRLTHGHILKTIHWVEASDRPSSSAALPPDSTLTVFCRLTLDSAFRFVRSKVELKSTKFYVGFS